MATVGDILDRANEMIDKHKDRAQAIGVRYRFVLHGEGGCTFLLNLTENPNVSQGDGEADCTIRTAATEFIRLAEGQVDSRELFFMGKLKVDGDMGLALKLKNLIASA